MVRDQMESWTRVKSCGNHWNFRLRDFLMQFMGEEFRRMALMPEDDVEDVMALTHPTCCESIPPWPQRNEDSFKRGKQLLQTLRLDALTFNADDLCHLLLEMFVELGLSSKLAIPYERIKRFICAVRAHMYDNPYHNFHHAFDVAQTFYALLHITGVIHEISELLQLACLFAAICHDLEHLGVNNNFLSKARTSFSVAYTQSSALEKHHINRGLWIAERNDVQLLSSLTSSDQEYIKDVITSLIMSTDMARHSEYLTMMRSRSTQDDNQRLTTITKLELLLKCADTSNVIKPFIIGKKWLMRVSDEFFLQGDKEKQLGLELTQSFDRKHQSRVGVQKGFVDFVILPFYTQVVKHFPELQNVIETIQHNRAVWENYTDKRLMLEAVADGYIPARSDEGAQEFLGDSPVVNHHQPRFGDSNVPSISYYRRQRQIASDIAEGRLCISPELKLEAAFGQPPNLSGDDKKFSRASLRHSSMRKSMRVKISSATPTLFPSLN